MNQAPTPVPVILCIDDQVSVLTSLEVELRHGLKREVLIETAESGQEGLEVLEELLSRGYDVSVVISDLRMPQMRGDEVLRRVVERSPQTRTILLTGQADLEDVGRAIRYARLYRYISKPWEPEDLMLTVQEALESYSQDQRLARYTQELEQMNQQLERLYTQERQQSQQTQQQQWAFLRRLIDSSPDMILVMNRSGRLVLVNQTAAKFYGLTVEDPFQELDITGLSPDLQSYLLQKNEWVLRTDQDLVIPDELQTNAQGEERWIQWVKRPLPLPGDEELCVLMVGTDLTERRRAELALQESETRFRSIFDRAPVGMVLDTLKGETLMVNPALAQMLDYSHSDLLRISFLDYTHPGDHGPEDRLYQELLRGQRQAYHMEKRCFRKDGQIIWVRVGVSLIYDNQGTPQFSLGILEDITEKKRSEEELRQAKDAAEAASRAKSAFLANMSHELRTPLNAILGFSQLLDRDASLTDQQRSSVDIINRSGEHLLGLINDVLDISKIEAGRMVLHQEGVDLHQMLFTLSTLFEERAQAKHLELKFEQDLALPHYVITDEGKLRQVLINLLANAIKFTHQGYVHLRAWPQGEAEDLHLQFEVEDTGEGIGSHELDRLFEPFVQTESGIRASTGSGLGLAICHQFVTLMGGEISVTSQVGSGTTFHLSIPTQTMEAVTVGEEVNRRRVVGLEPDQPRLRILVVDDRWHNRELLTRLLRSVGFEVWEAEDGQQAVERWLAWGPQLILMDMRMPVMDGYKATRRIREHPEGQGVVIIAITASALEGDRTIVLASGCDDYIRKPFQESVLFDRIARHLGVRYLYSEPDQPEDEPQGAEKDLDLAHALGQTPQPWRERLYAAATCVDSRLVLQIVDELPTEQAELAQILSTLVESFRFEEILDGVLETHQLTSEQDPDPSPGVGC